MARTIKLTDSVYADSDASGEPVGIEFVNADGFVAFLRGHADEDLPPQVRPLFRLTSA